MPGSNAEKLLFPRIGGSLREITECIEFLNRLVLTQYSDDRLSRTRDGDALARKIKKGEVHEFATFLLSSGALAEQIRSALAMGTVEDGSLSLSTRHLKKVSPQLIAVLARVPSVTVDDRISIPYSIMVELESAWNQTSFPPPGALRSDDLHLQVGERAELYSLQLERSAFVGASTSVGWISRDDPSAGYDLEIQHELPSRCVEVKGSRGSHTAFLLSRNELATARRLGERYEIQFWGDIRLHLRASDDFRRLRAAGFPLVVRDPATTLFTDQWICEPTQYRVRRA